MRAFAPATPKALDVASPPRHPPAVRRALPAFLLALPACSSTTPLGIDITTGQETTAFTDAPAVARVDVAVTSPIDSSLKLKVTSAPGGTFDLGTVPSDTYFTVNVSGFTDAGGTDQVMSGQSLTGLLAGGVSGDMPVFLQRTGQWARPPGGLACSHVGGVATVKENRAFLLTGGTRATGDTSCDMNKVDAYDMFGLTGLVTGDAFSPVPATMVSLLPSDNAPDAQVLLIAASGAVFLDYTTGGTQAASLPTLATGSFTFADVAGGTAIPASNGRWFVVGATRQTGDPTQAVLEVDADGTLGGYLLSAKRLGAAATWVDGTGLVVAGGSDGDPGLEVLFDNGATSFALRPYPNDGTVGAAAVDNGANSVLLVGGMLDGMSAPTRTLDLTCTGTCTQVTLGAISLPVTLQNANAYLIASGHAMVVGDDLSDAGQTHSYVVDVGHNTVTEAPLREPRRRATPVLSPNGTLAMVGGEHLDGSPALSIELFTP